MGIIITPITSQCCENSVLMKYSATILTKIPHKLAYSFMKRTMIIWCKKKLTINTTVFIIIFILITYY